MRVKRNWKRDELDKELGVDRSKIDRGEIKRSRDSDIHKARSGGAPSPMTKSKGIESCCAFVLGARAVGHIFAFDIVKPAVKM